MMKQKKGAILLAAVLTLTVLPGCSYAQGAARTPGKWHDRTEEAAPETGEAKSGGAMGDTQGAVIPEELEYIPAGYEKPAEHQGKLEKLTYRTYESFSYESRERELTKEAWVYVPYGYSEEEQYNVFYLSHGGWSNETTIMGTAEEPHAFKHVVDHAIEDGKIKPLIIVLPTYNNTSESDSGDYSLALRLSGSLTTDGEYMADIVRDSGHEPDDFFIFAASGTDDFAYSAFKQQIMAMGSVEDAVFVFSDNERDGNLAFREREGYVHDGKASNEYTYNGLMFF